MKNSLKYLVLITVILIIGLSSFALKRIYDNRISANKSVYKPKNPTIRQDTAAYGAPKVIKTYDTTENEYQSCTVSDMKWTPGDVESILLDPGPSWCFPGNIMDAKGFQNGKYTNITGKRNPITLVIPSSIFNKLTIVVNDPSLASISRAIDTMLNAGTKGSVGADFACSVNEVLSEDHLKLLINSKYSGGFGSVAAGFNFKKSNVKSRYILDLVQPYYSIVVETPKGEFFSERPTSIPTDLAPAPVYISRITYGRRVMIAVETEESDEQKDASLRAKMNAIATSGELDASIFSDQFFNNKSIKVLVKGGNAENSYKLFKAISKKEDIFDILQKDAYWSKDNLGAPLSFEARNTSDNTIFYLAQTGNYKARICEVKAQNDTTITPASLEHLCYWHVGGPDRNFGNNPFTNFDIRLKIDENHPNIINAEINSVIRENGGDGTTGLFHAVVPIVTLASDVEITEITSSTTVIQPDVLLTHQGQTPFFSNKDQFPVSLVSIIGDSPKNNNDDLCPCGCLEDNHAQLRTINFSPIKFSFSRKIKKVKSK